MNFNEYTSEKLAFHRTQRNNELKRIEERNNKILGRIREYLDSVLSDEVMLNQFNIVQTEVFSDNEVLVKLGIEINPEVIANFNFQITLTFRPFSVVMTNSTGTSLSFTTEYRLDQIKVFKENFTQFVMEYLDQVIDSTVTDELPFVDKLVDFNINGI